MDIQRMLADLNAERSRLDQAISALQGLESTAPPSTARRGRPPGRPAGGQTHGRRRMSADARRRISEAAKARWAERKGMSGRKSASAKKTPSAKAKRGRRGMSPAARKRMSEMMKARWAARKKTAKA
jgi:hypothetical protein